MQEAWIQPLGQEDPLEKEMATYSSILAWRIPWTEEPAGYRPMGHNELATTKQLNTFTFNKDIWTAQVYVAICNNFKWSIIYKNI